MARSAGRLYTFVFTRFLSDVFLHGFAMTRFPLFRKHLLHIVFLIEKSIPTFPEVL